jgi:flagellar hook-associated protein 2
VALDVDGSRLKGRAGTAYEGLVLLWRGTGSQAIGVTASHGVADRLFAAVESDLDDVHGSLRKSVDDLDQRNVGLEREIGRIEERAATLREQLVLKFAALETAMTMAKSMLDQVRASVGALSPRE